LATIKATVLLPEPAGPSMAMLGFAAMTPPEIVLLFKQFIYFNSTLCFFSLFLSENKKPGEEKLFQTVLFYPEIFLIHRKTRYYAGRSGVSRLFVATHQLLLDQDFF
jgi:hypothetical protein